MSSTLPHPNILAMLLGLLLPLLLAWSLAARSRWLRIGLGLGVLVELVALVLTLSRAGLLVTEVVLGLMLALAVRQRQATLARWSLSAAAGLLVLMGVALVAQPLVLLHLTGEGIQGWYAAAYSTPDGLVAAPGQLTTVPVVVRNTGARTWSATGEHAFALSYHLDRADGTLVDFEGARTFLPRDVPPGAAVELQALVQAPPAAGRYVVEWDGVQDQVTWFSWAGTPAARSQLIVAGAEGSGAREPAGGGRAVSAPPPAPDRLTQWRIALRMARYRPVLGIGPDNFRWRYGDFAGVARWDTGGHANSVYVEWLADTGVLGLGLFGWLAWVLVRASGRGLLCRSAGAEPGWLWRVGLAGSLVGWFLHGAVDYFYEPLGTNLGFWLIAGLALAMAPLATRSRSGVVDACG